MVPEVCTRVQGSPFTRTDRAIAPTHPDLVGLKTVIQFRSAYEQTREASIASTKQDTSEGL